MSDACPLPPGATPSAAQSVFDEIVSTHVLHIAPTYLGDILAGTRHHLDQSLLKYSHKLQGVPLCYGKVELSKYMPRPGAVHPPEDLGMPSAAILFDNPCVHVPVKVHWTVFTPRPGVRLLGEVNQMGREYVSLLVANYFTAIIYANHLEAVLKWNEEEEGWESKKTEKLIQIGQEISFEVIELLLEGPVFTIVGSLDRMLKEPSYESSKSPSGKKKNQTTPTQPSKKQKH